MKDDWGPGPHPVGEIQTVIYRTEVAGCLNNLANFISLNKWMASKRRSKRVCKPKIRFSVGETLRDRSRRSGRYVPKRKRPKKNPHGNFTGERDIRNATTKRVTPLIVHVNSQSEKV